MWLERRGGHCPCNVRIYLYIILLLIYCYSSISAHTTSLVSCCWYFFSSHHNKFIIQHQQPLQYFTYVGHCRIAGPIVQKHQQAAAGNNRRAIAGLLGRMFRRHQQAAAGTGWAFGGLLGQLFRLVGLDDGLMRKDADFGTNQTRPWKSSFPIFVSCER